MCREPLLGRHVGGIGVLHIAGRVFEAFARGEGGHVASRAAGGVEGDARGLRRREEVIGG